MHLGVVYFLFELALLLQINEKLLKTEISKNIVTIYEYSFDDQYKLSCKNLRITKKMIHFQI